MRQVKEWVGKTDDSRPPPSVELRIWKTHGGRCHLCEQKIHGGREAWEASHLKSIWDGGENRESNYAPAHKKCHRKHTDEEATVRATANRKAMKHLGIRKRSSFKSQGFTPAPKQNRATGEIDKWYGWK